MKLNDVLSMAAPAFDAVSKWPLLHRIVCTILYSFSPIDIIPDFIPVAGQMDDLYVIYQLIIKPALR